MRTEPTAEQVLPLPELLDEHREHEYVEVVLGNIDDDIAVKYVPQDLQAEENEPFAKMTCELLAHGECKKHSKRRKLSNRGA